MANLDFAYNTAEALKLIEENHYQIIFIDLNLGNENGFSLFKQIKEELGHDKTLLFILTASEDENIEALGHEHNIDEYLKKPISIQVLRAIIDKRLKGKFGKVKGKIKDKHFSLDIEKMKLILKRGKREIPVILTLTEFRIFTTLFSSPDIVFTREALYEKIWGLEKDSTFRAIDMHVSSLRKKLEDKSGFIKTVRGSGYKYVPA